MAYKTYHLKDVGEVRIYKKRGSKSLRISVGNQSYVRVSQPYWVPFTAGLKFIESKKDWVAQQQQKFQKPVLGDGLRIGKSHRLQHSPNAKNPRLNNGVIVVNLARSNDEKYYELIVKSCERALRKEAVNLLPQRLAILAKQHQFEYAGVKVTKMHSRWGSCSTDNQINLNIHLMQLPWPLIDYVLTHELAHTEHHNHSGKFWDRLQGCLPNAKILKEDLRQFQTQIMPFSD